MPNLSALTHSLRLSSQRGQEFLHAARANADLAVTGLWQRQPSTWSAASDVQAKIANRLGWLDSPALMAKSIDRLRAFGDGIRRDGFSDVVLLGMGGSSLAPEVLRAIVGVAPGWPRFHMLDSTDPDAVRALSTPAKTTLYVLASKSGGTIEPNMLTAHFRRALEDAGLTRWADHFVAITDEGTVLARRARDERFRDVFINPSDIGGRYSALSFFGMVPAALMGQDVAAMVDWGLEMLSASNPAAGDLLENPAGALGLFIGAAARTGRDKLTLLVPPDLEPFGLWTEQLVAESTGKHGVGVVPITGEPAGGVQAYGHDRAFVRIARNGEKSEHDSLVRELEAAGHPVATIDWAEPLSIGAEFVRWEIATAIAGALLEINPFDEPNVQQAKDATADLLGQYKSNGALPRSTPDLTLPSGVTLTASRKARETLGGQPVNRLLSTLAAGDYFAQLAYVPSGTEVLADLSALRRHVRDSAHVATTLGIGPRYLHSTGQLHKGGRATGVFLLITSAPKADLDIPGEPFTFGTLEHAQALGDFASLDAAGRRVVHAHLPASESRYVRDLVDAVSGLRT
jgi:glucose-6-phosphate isomerase